MFLLMTLVLIRFTNGRVVYTIIEEEPPGIVLGNIYDQFNITRKHYLANIILTQITKNTFSKIYPNLVTLETKSGNLKLNSKIDREKICPSAKEQEECLLDMQIYLSSIDKPLTANLLVIDINDNPPYFLSKKYYIKVILFPIT
ncbi:protocadherin beta-14-like [Octopus sinensis]|uniref:Protocadherin beta-14-like n=1 Tax=Octopus sinensis TaxID=2607531 RepID=A0A6P7TSY0_9MOLL|nr:protocadherin beta-14-like [Octopus sinensis]